MEKKKEPRGVIIIKIDGPESIDVQFTGDVPPIVLNPAIIKMRREYQGNYLRVRAVEEAQNQKANIVKAEKLKAIEEQKAAEKELADKIEREKMLKLKAEQDKAVKEEKERKAKAEEAARIDEDQIARITDMKKRLGLVKGDATNERREEKGKS